MDSSVEDQENNNAVKKTPQQRKVCYRNLLNKVEEIQENEDLGLQAVNEVGEILREANSLDTECVIDERVDHADETLLDSLVLSSASSILKKCVEAVDVFTSTYDPSELTNKIISNVKDDDEDYQPEDILKLLKDARMIIPKLPEYCNVYGAYDLNQVPVPKQKKVRVKQPKENFQKKEPEKVTQLDKEEEGIEEIVKVLHDVLMREFAKNGERCINYYDYVIDTDSFNNTIENMFYCSFLIRDGRAEIDLDSRGKPTIKPVKKKLLKDFRDDGGVNAQMITAITIEEWEKYNKSGFLQKHRIRSAKE